MPRTRKEPQPIPYGDEVLAWVAANYPCEFTPEIEEHAAFGPGHPQAGIYSHRYFVAYNYTPARRKRRVIVARTVNGTMMIWRPV